MNSVRSNNLSLKNEKFRASGCKDAGIRKFEFVAKTHFLCLSQTCAKYQKKDELLGHKVALSHKPTYSFCTVQSDLFAFINI